MNTEEDIKTEPIRRALELPDCRPSFMLVPNEQPHPAEESNRFELMYI